LVDQLQSFFRVEELSSLARSTKFIQRSSKICEVKFLDLLFKDAAHECGMSLLDYSNEAQSAHGISVSAQGVDDRFNDYAVKFLRHLVNGLFNRKFSQPFDDSFLQRYSSVNIWDSTKKELPEDMAEDMAVDFPGFGGSSSSAAISMVRQGSPTVQYRYDIKNNTGCSLDVYPATSTDSDYTRQIPIEGNSLEIFDLGYVSHDFLDRLGQGGSYYVCRLHIRADIYDLVGQEYDLEKRYRWMRLFRIPVYSEEVLVGHKRLRTRLVITLVDEQTYQKRLKKLQKDSRRKTKGWVPTNEYKLRMRMNLMLTNTDIEEIPDEKVYGLYKLRWQVELIFKNWKSSGWHLDRIKDVKYTRYMCILYAKLLMIILSDRIYSVIAAERYRRHGQILSRGKCGKTLCDQIRLIRQLINASVDMMEQILDKIELLFSRGHILCRRKGRRSYQDLYDSFTCKSE
jgi:hypothetical protein